MIVLILKREIGDFGEAAACRFLKRNKYKILDRNYSKPYGEIDIIAAKGDTVSFVEVKTRKGSAYGAACEAVDFKKRQRIIRTAYAYIAEKGLDAGYSLDIIEVYADGGRVININHLINAFGE